MTGKKKSDDLQQKANDLNNIAWQLRISDSIKAKQYGEQAIELSRTINYKQGVADGLRVEAFGHIRIADINNALRCLDEAEIIYTFIDDVKGLAVINEYRGIIERNSGNSATALELIFKALDQSRQTAFTENEVTNLYQLGVTYKSLANYDKALDYLYKSLSLARITNFILLEGYDLNIIGSIYFETGDYDKALDYYQQGLLIRQKSGDKWGEAGSFDNIGYIYFKLKDYTNAIKYATKSLEITRSIGDKKGEANALLHLAEVFKETNDFSKALRFSNESLQLRKINGDRRGEAEILLLLAELQNTNEISEDKDKFKKLTTSLMISKEIKANDLASKIYYRLYKQYKLEKNFAEATNYLEQHIQLEKELHKDTINQKVLNLEMSHKAEEAWKEAEAIKLKNAELTDLNNEILQQKKKIEEALAELKSTQAQLIQSEKMASLGELTAGIAHEIQNPLNFVNNFSELNKEMIVELKEEISKGNYNEVSFIASNIESNEEKINQHGKRADAIVKSMLQHSRTSSGKMELTDINTLCDEYVKLAFHGFRAKDKSFNAKFETAFGENVSKLNLVPQEIGRVVLNLINNAFYAVNERQKAERLTQNAEGYEPTVIVSTKKEDGKVIISVKDNGNGIAESIKEKIFQPFFTTKPTGEGTGLGLSLSYDIIKAHGGEISLDSKEKEGTEFMIFLPI